MATPVKARASADERPKTPLVPKSPVIPGKSPVHVSFNANDDELERQQVRAAKAAAQRKALLSDLQAASSQSGISRESRELSSDRVMSLYQNCIKLAAENKINQKNSWDLDLIDHMTTIVKADVSENRQTNFQKASCTLEAGVKIYSYRVDSVHSETFKVLSGLNRSSLQDDEGSGDVPDEALPDDVKDPSEAWKKSSLSTTLESSFDSLNVKKFDAAYAVDPLFHQTSAQFDEGGARGLLLYNLNVAQDLRIMFDSVEVESDPARTTAVEIDRTMVDLSPFSHHLEVMLQAAERHAEISPALEEALSMLEDPRRAAASGKVPTAQVEEPETDRFVPPETQFEIPSGDAVSDGDGESHVEDAFDDGWAPLGDEPQNSYDGEVNDPEEVPDPMAQPSTADWLAFSMGLASAKENTWGGPKHWRFSQKTEDLDAKAERPRGRKSDRTELLDFSSKPQVDWSLLRKPLSMKDINLPKLVDRSQGSRFLPPKHKMDMQSLAKLYLKPGYGLHSRGKKQAYAPQQGFTAEQMMDFGTPDFDDDNHNDDFDDSGENAPPAWTADEMLAKPKQIEKIEVTYARRSKQVDVKALKDTIWGLLNQHKGTEVSLKTTLSLIPDDCPAAPIEDISVHLCFISLLHLANENSLVLTTPASMDEVRVGGFSTSA